MKKKQNFTADSTLKPPTGVKSGSCIVDILIKFRNGYRKIMQSIRIKSRPPVTIYVMLVTIVKFWKQTAEKRKKIFHFQLLLSW